MRKSIFDELEDNLVTEKKSRKCTLAHFVEGEVVQCNGDISSHEIYKPFDEFTPIGGNYRPPVIDCYESCSKCGVRYNAT